MLTKYYYQATSSWVVLFAPNSDGNIVFYNEFMHYLGEKQRAAVVKLDEKVTLFLVPPSEVSQQVVRVPGKVSISGVILKFQHNLSSLHQALEVTETQLPPVVPPQSDLVSIHEDQLLTKPRSPELRAFSKSQSYCNPSLAPLPPPPYPPTQKLSNHLPYNLFKQWKSNLTIM